MTDTATTIKERGDRAMQYRYAEITREECTALDLRDVEGDVTYYRITIYDEDGEHAHAETADAVYGAGRLGIAWGAPATWADVDDLESGIATWINDPDEWESRN